MSNRTLIDEIEEALERATPGPFFRQRYTMGGTEAERDWRGDAVPVHIEVGQFCSKEDAELDVLLRNNAKPLLAVVRASSRLANVQDFDNHDCQYFPGGVKECELCDWLQSLRTLDPRLLGE